MVEERHHLGPSDGGLVHTEVEAARRGHAADRRELGPAALMDEDRCLAYWRPRLRRVRDQREAALVEKHHYGSSPAGFFLNRGQERCFQFFTATRFFSLARREGRCQESPWRLSSRHIALLS